MSGAARAWKRAAGSALFALGAQRALLRDTGVVVAFHRVNDRTAGDALSVGVADFARFCRFFRAHFDVIPLGALLTRLERGQPLAGCLAISFDDGYLDNYSCAAPVLQQLGLPATFFAVSSFLGSRTRAWWDAGIEPAPPWMSWAQLRELHAAGFEIGAHTHTHANLGEIRGKQAREEILRGKDELEQGLGAAVSNFAYPYGRANALSEENRALVRELGLRSCASCHGGLIRPDTEPFRLPRVPINGWFASAAQFGLEVALGRA